MKQDLRSVPTPQPAARGTEVTKHTLGPWVAVDVNSEAPYIVADQGKKWNNPVICNLYDDVTPSDSVTIGPWLQAHDNAKANARLIAAAPDLLEALKIITDDVCDRFDMESESTNPGMKWAVKEARAAIAKATRGAA